MQESIRLGRVQGIPIGLNWSLLLIFALVAVALAAGRFPVVYPDYPPAAYALAGLATAVLFFASILAHELGHALLAKAKGVEVEGITLWLFGGVARFSTEPTSPRDELKIAGVGPLISLLLGGVCWAVATGLDAAGVPDLVVGVFVWLALINVVLGLFNLIPAAPLDGGRVLRALLWARSGSRQRAGVSAARGGRVFGLVLIGLGVLEFAFGAGLGGIWFMLLGFFILTAARAEETHSRLQGVRVRDVMTPEPVTAPDWLPVQDFLDQYVFQHRCSTFPLRGFDGGLAGVVTLRAVKRVAPEKRLHVRLRELACPMERVPTVGPDGDLAELLPRMAGTCTDGRALVLEDGELVGIVSPSDIARVVDLADLRGSRREPHIS